MREIEVKILRGAETDNRRYQTYTVAVEEDAAVSVKIGRASCRERV